MGRMLQEMSLNERRKPVVPTVKPPVESRDYIRFAYGSNMNFSGYSGDLVGSVDSADEGIVFGYDGNQDETIPFHEEQDLVAGGSVLSRPKVSDASGNMCVGTDDFDAEEDSVGVDHVEVDQESSEDGSEAVRAGGVDSATGIRAPKR